MNGHLALPAHVDPPEVSHRLRRGRLLGLLQSAMARPGARAIWIGAPSGLGKSTLAASCAAESRAAVWLRLDASDADPGALVQHLHDARHSARGLPAPEGLPRPAREQLARPDLLLRGQARALLAGWQGHGVWVLDDLQAVGDAPALILALQALIDELRQGQTLLLLSQQPPPAVLERAILAGKLVVLPARELAFDDAETRAWVAQVGLTTAADGSPTSTQAEGLQALCAGWPVAVDLLARGGAEPFESALVRLIETTIWPALSAEQQAVLDAAAWLPTLDEREAPAAVLDGLARQAWLVDRGSQSPAHWRVHALLGQYLQQRQRAQCKPAALAQAMAEAAQRLETRGAAIAPERTDDLGEALRLWQQAATLDASHWPSVDRVLCRLAPPWLAACRHAGLRIAVQAIPAEHRSGQAWWWLAQAELPRSPAHARACADRALERLPADDKSTQVQCHALAIASHFQAFDDTRPLAARVQALHTLGVTAHQHAAPPAQQATVAVAVWSALFLREPTHPDCTAWHDRVRALAHQPLDPNLKLRAAMLLAKQAWYSGHHHDLALLGPWADSEIGRPGVSPYARLLWGLMQQYSTWADGDWARGLQITQQALDEAHDSGIHLLDIHLQLHGACFAHLQGRQDLSETMLDQVTRTADGARHMETWHHAVVRAWLALSAGEEAQAHAVGHSAVRAAAAMGPAPMAMALAVQSHALQALGATTELHHTRRALATLPLPPDHTLAAVHLGFIDARTALDLGDREGALNRIARVLGRVRAHALWVPFGVPARALAPLLSLALKGGVETASAHRMIAAMALQPPADADGSWPWPVRVTAAGAGMVMAAIEVRGRPLPSQGKQQKRPLELLQALVARGGRATTTQLADQLWPDAEGDLALGALETALRRLRHLLDDPQAVVLSGGVLSLDRSRVWIEPLRPGGVSADRPALSSHLPGAAAPLADGSSGVRAVGTSPI
jgi:LuxR family transcriptional regulator, maltose regulon positive regulatory protein